MPPKCSECPTTSDAATTTTTAGTVAERTDNEDGTPNIGRTTNAADDAASCSGTTTANVDCGDCRRNPYNCPSHGAMLRAAILARNTDVQKAAVIERNKRIAKHRFCEEHFRYQGDTVVIWDVREFRRRIEWRTAVLKKTARARRQQREEVAAVPRIKSSRRRFRRILRQRYRHLSSSLQTTSTAAGA
jgi:hypothetical protein